MQQGVKSTQQRTAAVVGSNCRFAFPLCYGRLLFRKSLRLCQGTLPAALALALALSVKGTTEAQHCIRHTPNKHVGAGTWKNLDERQLRT
jgi:hypothetical protein